MPFRKLITTLKENLAEASILEPNALQAQCYKKITGGSDMFIQASAQTGKTSTLLIAIIQKLKYAFEESPRALLMVESTEQSTELLLQAKKWMYGSDLRALAVYEHKKPEDQCKAIYDGTDLIIGTPKAIIDLYYNNVIDVNMLKLVAIDNADLMYKNGYQLPLERLTQSIPKCQRIITTTVSNEKIDRLSELFLHVPFIETLEVEAE